ncbi:MAG TPA: cell division protein FtsQ/DivIB [Arenimonas sp.]|uniref:cell division protein FtsQ/DivIB n=1 Tax=Arenimonas sp. TaxID=1872635 RepID=UPI002B9D4C7B|nr:cell division protein FtsQ/DivIB [Arenimonas sp.]HMB56339.1 cell division protein FtsQ/DivIB [Arenimonas sp.]
MNAVLRIAAWIFAIVLVALPVVAVVNGWIGGSRWPMRHLAVTGEFSQVSDAQIRAAVMPNVRNGFFAVDLDRVRTALAALPWVKHVEVRKRWPDRLEVSISEYKPLAHWGEERMLSEHGELFPAPKGVTANLPQFIGPDSRASELMAFYSQARPLFLGNGLAVRTVELSARGSWNLSLSDGTRVEVGRGDPQSKLQRFARLLPRIRHTDSRTLDRADLRYTNGFALTWRAADATAPTPLKQAGI